MVEVLSDAIMMSAIMSNKKAHDGTRNEEDIQLCNFISSYRASVFDAWVVLKAKQTKYCVLE